MFVKKGINVISVVVHTRNKNGVIILSSIGNNFYKVDISEVYKSIDCQINIAVCTPQIVRV